MNDVGREDEIVAVEVDSLVGGILLDVEDGVLHEGIVREFALGVREEGGPVVGKGVLGAVRGKDREDGARQRARAGADFEDAQRAAVGEFFDGFLDLVTELFIRDFQHPGHGLIVKIQNQIADKNNTVADFRSPRA